ncbi:ATP-dependent helicase HrpA, partial [Corynebacterium coyleae]
MEANRLGVLDDVTVIVAAMTIQDVRERPLEYQAQADQAHARFKDKESDFLSSLKLWDYIGDSRDELSGNAFRKRMKREFLHYMRIREWRDLVRNCATWSDSSAGLPADSVAGERD